MNLAAIAKRAVRAVPSALRATATYARVVPGTYDPLTDLRTGDTTQSFTASGPLTPLEPDQLKDVAPAELTRFRQHTIAAADASFRPSPADTTCTIAGETWKVVDVQVIAPNGVTDVAYSVRLHR